MRKKDVFTTGQVAEICNVAPRTVTKWFDSGQLKGYRIPGSRDRRIPLHELLRFMKSHDIPTEGLDVGKLKVLLVDSDDEFGLRITKLINSNPKYLAKYAANSFEAGLVAQKIIPNVIVVNLMSAKIDAMEICRAVRFNGDLQGGKVVAITGELGESEAKAIMKKGFDGFVKNPTDVHDLLRAVEEASDLVS